ncbi:MAG: hypothetical protein AAF564_00505 [Bacteroidota bacterium]
MANLTVNTSAPRRHLTLWSIFVFMLSVAFWGCEKEETLDQGPFPGEGTPPSIEVPGSTAKLPLDINPEILDELSNTYGGRISAKYPAHDGDRFFVTLPAREASNVATGDVFSQLITPLLGALGFDRGTDAFRLPPNQGVPMARANYDGLIQAVQDEYGVTEQLFKPRTRFMLEALQNRNATPEIDMALEMGEGMNLNQFIAGIEREAIAFPFVQVDADIPIEHTMILAQRWEGQGITSIRGVFYNKYDIANSLVIQHEDAVSRAIEALRQVEGVDRVADTKEAEDGPYLMLLPYGSDAAGVTYMRYAYRMILQGYAVGRQGGFQLWSDAENGDILKLEPLFSDVGASGTVYNRDPGVATRTASFQVDPESGGNYTLQLSGVLNRVDYLGNGFDADDVSINAASGGSSPTFANFNQAPINDATQALCASGTNKAFQQVNFFGVIHRYYQRGLSLGVFTPFPTSPWNPRVESASAGCNAWSTMDYGACQGYTDAACPNFSTGTISGSNYMNFAHDNTVVGHELAHNLTDRFTNTRPADWCGVLPCPIPVGWGRLHDLADFWADHFDSTNCTAGWVAKNQGGVNNSLNCANHNEGGGLPRLHEVAVPFNPAAIGDHFPEHRAISTIDYADSQIGAAALWQVRLGMRSKCRPSGMPQFAVRFARALRETGFFGTAPAGTDQGIFNYLYDLEVEMVEQWASSGSPGGPPAFRHNGPHTTNKVTAGFAKTGLFLTPDQCIDSDAATSDPTFCPSGENGGDSVIDIDDNDLGDDLSINGVDHPEVDFLELGGPAPTFHVWTGPRYRFDGTTGLREITNPAPCNSEFQVEVADDPTFPGASTITSPWIGVDVDPTTPDTPECYGNWSPSDTQWTMLQSGGALTRLYYRSRTRDAGAGNIRLSTEPGAGLWSVPAPYAVLTTNGQSDY